MSAHTPGPWKFETVRTSCGICHKIGEFKRGTKITHACVYDDYGNDHNPESQALLANARLMAAAPELLAAAQEALRMLNHFTGLTQKSVVIDKVKLRGDIVRFNDLISPAIAKATGAAS